ncbi:transcription-repair coupling factor [Halonatronum saccharophilum]|uniref:transcription-repair coupling factor n=1 Tax=Halonatronum saccharophilum TaxID=150060 RepID=UPI0004872CFA|nr:transcription-repair coupling factor [Halonatronum saccharophilum]
MGNSLLNILKGNKVFEKTLDSYDNGIEGEVVGLDDSSQNLFLANLDNSIDDRMLIVTPTLELGESIFEDLVRLLGEERVLLFPKLDILPHEELEIEQLIKVERLKVLDSLTKGEGKVIIAPIGSLLEVVIPSDLYKDLSLDLTIEDEIILDQLSYKLVSMGYSRVQRVEDRGEYSIRGGVVDIYPPILDEPVRIEFFGDEIESIRSFDVATQVSSKELEDVSIDLAREFIITSKMRDDIIKSIKSALKEEITSLPKDKAKKLKEKVAYDLERLEEGVYFPGVRKYLNYAYGESTLADYFNGVVIFINPFKVKEEGVNFLKQINGVYLDLVDEGKVLSNYKKLFLDFYDLFYKIQDYKLYLSPLKREVDYINKGFSFDIKARKVEVFRGSLDRLIDSIKGYVGQKYKIVIGMSTLSKARRLEERLEEEFPVSFIEKIEDQIKLGNIVITIANLNNGVLFSDDKFILYTESEIFKVAKRKRRRAKAFKEGAKISSFTELDVGDYVVHENHGIGKYLGIKKLKIQGKSKDYLLLLYAKDDKLYIPTDQVDLIQKYVGLQDKKPKLHKLNSDSWNRAKARVKESVEEMAEELLELYAKRELKRGHSFSEDTIWQNEFEESFPFEETPDQIKAITEVKEDMESNQPMDRLICGDVGYGKTEVGIRAIFKAIMDGKQAAFLVPTTILAQQHWSNFVDRFSDYPIRVEVLSRFKSAKEQKEIIKGLKRGSVDLIIGTHRLLSSDIKFKDLGLVVVDEEQRFGVKQKERLKRLRESVDILTLTATPIPRTLHMSLVGVRDISLIETPPENRYPIRTYVGEYEEHLIKDAINREINRGGQIYFVHNRVRDIKEIAAKINTLVPKARVGVAHGQMSEVKLEDLMMKFLAGEYDVLVCTTIIETGMDISNVNTIIINRADRFGLAQLYQLRGRVGRSSRLAYAYLLYKKDQVLSEIAEKRLKAIKEFTSLGSGFKIAMRDLEIRGAGNILGPQQHGHIEAIGFSLYCKLLEGAVNSLKKGEVKEEEEISLDLKVDAYIPDDYIGDSKEKIDIYKKIDGIRDIEDYEEIKDELRDRFGDLREEIIILLQLALIKVKGKELGLLQIKELGQSLEMLFSSEHRLSGENLINLSNRFSNLKFTASKELVIKVSSEGLSDLRKLNLLIDIFDFLLSD